MENEHYIQTHTEQKHKVRRAVSIINNESELQNDGERRGNNNPWHEEITSLWIPWQEKLFN